MCALALKYIFFNIDGRSFKTWYFNIIMRRLFEQDIYCLSRTAYRFKNVFYLLSPLLSNDKRFFIKTQSKREVRFLLSILRIYMEHLEKYPHSLLVKFLGENQPANKHIVSNTFLFSTNFLFINVTLMVTHGYLYKNV